MSFPRVRDYPSVIQIRDELWEIRFKRKIYKEGGWEHLGECDPSTNTIYIKLGESKQTTFKTFVHEVLHAIQFTYEISEKDLTHKAIYSLEDGFCDLYKHFWFK